MRSVEVSASTREEAIKMALEKLGADRHEVDVEILDEGSRGIFGIGARPVRLRVTDETARHEPEAQRPPSKREEDRDDSGDSGESRERRPRGRRGGRNRRGGGQPEGAETAEAAAPKEDKPERSRRERPERPERGSRGGRSRRGGRREEGAAEAKEAPQSTGSSQSAGASSQPRGGSSQEQGGGGQEQGGGGQEQGDEKSGTRSRRRRRGGATRREGVRKDTRPRNSANDAGQESGASEPSSSSRREERSARERDDSGGAPEKNGGRPARERQREREPRPAPEPSEPISEERAVEASALLTEIIEMMGMQATITHELQEDGGCTLRVATEDSALLIGRKAQTLLALQYLVNRVIRQHEEENLQLIMVDIEGYIERRRDELTDLALRMAEQAKDERRRVRLKPLTPQERRIVHLALQDDEDLRTFSVGDGAIRSVVIAPKDEEAPAGGRRGGRGRGGRRDNGDDRPRRVEGRFAGEDAEESGEAGNVSGESAEVPAGHHDSGPDDASGESRRPDDE